MEVQKRKQVTLHEKQGLPWKHTSRYYFLIESKVDGRAIENIFLIRSHRTVVTMYTFFLYKEHLYKELEAEKGSKNKEFLRN